MTGHGSHDAPGQLSGYLYQVLAALLLLLETKEPEGKICVEGFDDVAFVENDVPKIMIQTKHHFTKQGNLGDTSVDLWRTINSWCDSITDHQSTPTDTRYIILTTAVAKAGSAASCLSNAGNRDWRMAKNTLFNVAETNKGQTNISFYRAFLALGSDEQENLVKHIYIYDMSPTVANIRNDIMPYIRSATLPQFEERVYDKVVGWWIRSIIQCLVSVEPVFISYRQLQQQIFDIGSEYKADSLPIDVDPFYQPTEEELAVLSPQNRVFIEQLNLLALSHDRLMRCIRDYYNAYRQRSQWVRENLLFINDLMKYESTLVDEWNRLFLIMKDDITDYGDALSDKEKRRHGKILFERVEELNLPIRRNVTQPFIMRGTFHELANQLRVGWHVDYMEQFCHLLKG